MSLLSIEFRSPLFPHLARKPKTASARRFASSQRLVIVCQRPALLSDHAGVFSSPGHARVYFS